MDDEPMWAADRVVAPTLGSAITIHETANEFALKGNHLTLVKGNQFDGRTKTDPHKHIHKFLEICDMFKYRDIENEVVRLMIFFPPALFDRLLREIRAFSQHENESLTGAWLRMKEMFRNCHGHNLSKGNIITIFYHGLNKITQEVLNVVVGDNPNDQQNNSETPINFDSDDEDDEPTLQPKTQPPKLVKETSLPKPYKPKIPYPQRLRKEKMEAQYEKFLDMVRAVRINVPLVDVLARMPNYGKFIKELISNKHKIKQISAAFLSDESSAMIQNKVPPKLIDPGSYLIPCNFNKNFSCNALADLGASINLMPYSLYSKLSLETLKPTKMSVRLADRSFQYPVGIAENMLIKVGKFTFPVDFVILEIEEDNKVPLILG
ncbi:reverse transcriptase domain-containing protein [Tanacetum coccineum]|uniref:Reverse transcriptase domain-containing protein n=1 Tax=Tanacetum coccineum TaxID=301880 RepID=A0ABQ5CR21_9ASTR